MKTINSNIMFTKEQINKLLANDNVEKCTPNSITYKADFKLSAVRKYLEEGYSPRMIFEEAGFDLNIIGVNRADDSLLRWRRKYSVKGKEGIKEDQRGKIGKRPSKPKFKNDKEKIRYLEAKVKYLDAENDFLAKLRGFKRE